MFGVMCMRGGLTHIAIVLLLVVKLAAARDGLTGRRGWRRAVLFLVFCAVSACMRQSRTACDKFLAHMRHNVPHFPGAIIMVVGFIGGYWRSFPAAFVNKGLSAYAQSLAVGSAWWESK
jgi:hypothetical protein